MANSRYNSKDVSLIIAGFEGSGYADDGHIKVDPVQKERFSSQVGVNGESNWSENNDERHKITVSLLANSPFNLKLETLASTGVTFPVMVKNTSDGKYVGGGTDARIIERQATEFGKDQKNRTWVIQCNDYKGLLVG